MPIRCILFDLDNTLIDRDFAFEKYMEAAFSEGGKPEIWQQHKVTILEKDNHGFTSRRDFFDWLRRTYQLDDSFMQFFDGHLVGTYTAPSCKGIVSVLKQLSAYYKVGILSNGGVQNQQLKLKRSGLGDFFDSNNIFISGALGCAKPDLQIFRKVESQLGFSSDALLIIGDDPQNDIEGGEKAGWSTCHFEYRQGAQQLRQKVEATLI
ncbi:HAD family hydrolase [Limibacter armeniacum]|uniref:HAD family hydrolase n=1 Tax=Limibacter armeniacum TaxID=466084 RepID=UPI002FE59598